MAEVMNHAEVTVETPDHSDYEGDNFEDAQDAYNHHNPPRMNRQSSSASTRSLTGGASARGSPLRDSTSSDPNAKSPSAAAETPRSKPEENESDEAQESKPAPKSVAERVAALQQQKKKIPVKPSTPPLKRPPSSSKRPPSEISVKSNKQAEEVPTPPAKTPEPTESAQKAEKASQPVATPQEATGPSESASDYQEEPSQKTPKPSLDRPFEVAAAGKAAPEESAGHSEPAATETPAEATEDVPLETPKPPKRSSAAFQEVELTSQENGQADETESQGDSQEKRGRQMSMDSPRSPKSTTSASHSRSNSRVPSISEKASGLASSAGFGFGNWGAGKNTSSHASGKKMSGPWGWLSRKKTAPDPSPPPPQQPPLPRQNSSASTGSQKPDLKLSKIESEPVPAKDQLKERFKLARMKEQAGINVDQITTPRSSVNSGAEASQDNNANRISDSNVGVHSPTSVASVSEAASPIDAPKRGHKARAPSLAQSITIDPKMAPGTVSGTTHGPSAMADPEAPVDWDLWQSVVYEGPAAVAKSSPAELSRSIASGIPNPIRGVVWQVLAESKNEELEAKYHELVARGTDKEVATSPAVPPTSSKSPTSNDPFKEAVVSSASSIRSETDGVASPATSTYPESEGNPSKAQADKKKRDEQAAIKKIEKTIRKDLGARSNYSKYFAAKEMQDDLFGVCKAYALYDEAVGYAQGMNFIVMPLLFNMPAEEAFCLLVSLMNNYKLRDTFTPEMPGLHRQLYQFERILEDTNMKLCRHLSRKGITPSLYATQWFITLFAYKLPLQLVLRVYDLVLSEGLETAVLKFAVALVVKNAEKLLALNDMTALKTFLNEKLFDAYIDSSPSSHSILEQGFFGSSGGSEKDVYRADLLVQDACTVSIPSDILKGYADEYETKTKAEKDRQQELEELKATLTSQTAKIRSLEERVEKSDTEHVQITQEMIKSRMENEDLKTSGHEHIAEIEKLKKELENAPEQVETSLKEQMDSIMARNNEVQSQNRVLEEQMAEMEKDLVETKMQFAQVNGDYEALKQKWSDLRRALGD